MAEEIKIVITNETDGERVPVSIPEQPAGTTSGVASSPEKVEREQARGKVVGGIVVARQLKPYVDQIVGFGVSQIEATTGSAELQQRAQVISGAVSSVAGIAMGAAVGGVPGAAVAAALTVIQTTMSVAQNQAAIENRKRIERELIERRTSVLGQSVNRSRTGGAT